jgi:hypothetical protein
MAIRPGRKTERASEPETGSDWRRAGQREGRRLLSRLARGRQTPHRPVGSSPREALDAWHLQCGLSNGDIEPENESGQNGTKVTIDKAIERYLIDIKAAKGGRTYKECRHHLDWFRTRCAKRYVSEPDRSDAMKIFAQGREERVDGKVLNQKTINKRVMVMLGAMRSQGAVIEMKKGDWPKTIEKKVEIYQPEELTKFFAGCEPEERLIFQVFL